MVHDKAVLSTYNGKLYMIYQTAPFSTTLKDP